MSVEASRRSSRARRVGAFLGLALLSGAAEHVGAQVAGSAPPVVIQIPDTAAAADSAQVPDSLAQDSISADTIFYNLPSLDWPSRYGPPTDPPSDSLPPKPPTSESFGPLAFVTGVWEWDRTGIMESGANTLAELVGEVPGLIVLLGGDYGTPAAMSAFGAGGGGVRILRDGFEVFPIEGGVADLQRVGLGGIARVRFERNAGELQIEMTSHQYAEGRAFSLIEAGTGQLDTNMFRGMYADPTALRGSLAVALERVDTRGYGQNEGGNRTGTWFRYQLHRGNRAGIAFEHRRMGSETQVPVYASSASRTEWTVRARAELMPGLAAELYTGHATHDVQDPDSAYRFEGGSRSQHGARLAATLGALWARGEYRYFPGDDMPAGRFDAAAGLELGRSGFSARVARAAWEKEPVTSYRGAAWIRPLPAMSIFGSWDAGTYGARSGPQLEARPAPDSLGNVPPPPPGPTFAVSERTALRVGGALTFVGTTVAVAALRTDTDAHLPLGLELDRGGSAVPGIAREGLEAWGSVPTPWRSLRLEGSYQVWDSDGPYLPKQTYRGAFVFRKTYLESGNFELWWTLGVRGHDPMDVFSASGGLVTVPFYQSWYGRIQARILSVRLFLGWENFTIRRNLQNFPDRLLPVTRSFFGLHWDLWN